MPPSPGGRAAAGTTVGGPGRGAVRLLRAVGGTKWRPGGAGCGGFPRWARPARPHSVAVVGVCTREVRLASGKVPALDLVGLACLLTAGDGVYMLMYRWRVGVTSAGDGGLLRKHG